MIQDAIAELEETFEAVLTNPSGGLAIGDDNTATVTILGDSGQFMNLV